MILEFVMDLQYDLTCGMCKHHICSFTHAYVFKLDIIASRQLYIHTDQTSLVAYILYVRDIQT